ncbi:hypothetical protein FACS1894186_5950 [Alphaproteobacteria bacterium]|nr:hypothetical protein FACS1894186_5950 [Alphaproteobacteria bacterium]
MRAQVLPIDQKLWLTEAELAAAMSLTAGELSILRAEADFPRAIRVKRSRKYLREEVQGYARSKFGASSGDTAAARFFAES